jgi:hypothetical protein
MVSIVAAFAIPGPSLPHYSSDKEQTQTAVLGACHEWREFLPMLREIMIRGESEGKTTPAYSLKSDPGDSGDVPPKPLASVGISVDQWFRD